MLIGHYYQTCVNGNIVWVQKIITPLTVMAQFILFSVLLPLKKLERVSVS